MTDAQMRGVYAIPPTPFTAEGALDLDGLGRVVRFCLEAGVPGLVAPVNASEFPFLSDDERRRVVEVVVAEAAGRARVVAGVSGTSTEHALLFARHAREVGADAVIAMPPYVRTAGRDEIRTYFEAVAREARLPVFIQNHLPPQGTVLSPALVAGLVNGIDGVSYVKEETWPPGQHMTETMRLCGPRLRGIMGGIAGRYLIDEHRRGSCGTMPACEVADVHVQVWDRLEAGDADGARRLFNALLPLLNLEAIHGVALYKHVLHRRGLIDSPVVRQPGLWALDDLDRREVDAVLAELSTLFRVPGAELRPA
ncbi:MAG TPA: dihydrodipicolinate synthase family protein [Candidatus Dormibacteraeota bacterium]|jgi:4-hydroxy-tetrahydrodipicolinate synthase|nr:dihydrodipicolinate synthase family protein [Candidatus Dormibacteraeota bacterium]